MNKEKIEVVEAEKACDEARKIWVEAEKVVDEKWKVWIEARKVWIEAKKRGEK